MCAPTTPSWIGEHDPDALIEVLWQVGFLQAAAGGVGARRVDRSGYVGPHQVANLNLLNIQRFQIHPMFWAYLGLQLDPAA